MTAQVYRVYQVDDSDRIFGRIKVYIEHPNGLIVREYIHVHEHDDAQLAAQRVINAGLVSHRDCPEDMALDLRSGTRTPYPGTGSGY